MALTTTISTKELQRVAAAAYEGETLKVMLCQVALTGFTAENTVTQWIDHRDQRQRLRALFRSNRIRGI
jgi:hypothetical protein